MVRFPRALSIFNFVMGTRCTAFASTHTTRARWNLHEIKNAVMRASEHSDQQLTYLSGIASVRCRTRSKSDEKEKETPFKI